MKIHAGQESTPNITANDVYLRSLNEAIRAGDLKTIAIMLRGLAEKTGNMAALARSAGLSRPTLYAATTAGNNQKLSSFLKLTRALKLEITVE